ncbi:putative capsid portal protein [Escherichia coli DEC13A]|nr:putative capsid portal protein [Escherichia coli DEC13A]
MSRKNKKVRMSSRIDLADALRKESSLSAFTFDGPYRLTGHDLLDNMYCADNGRWYETPVGWYGLARAAGKRPGISLRFTLSAMYCSVATSRTAAFPAGFLGAGAGLVCVR